VKVLLVEDAEGMRKIVGSMLRSMGFDDVLTASDGKEALQILEAMDVGLLLTNWSMPVMDGLELVREARAQPWNTTLPIVMFSSKASRADIVVAMEAGVDGYVAKPFAPVQLREQIAYVLGRQAKKRIQHVTGGLDRLKGGDEHPLLIVGEKAVQPRHLERAENREVLGFLDRAVSAVSAINGDSDPPLIGLTASDDSCSVIRLMRSVGPRAKAVLVNAKMSGGITLARLTAVNKRFDVDVFVTCDQKSEIPEKIRSGMGRLL
jgi:two-component system chemotaxis response regulator CheY